MKNNSDATAIVILGIILIVALFIIVLI